MPLIQQFIASAYDENDNEWFHVKKSRAEAEQVAAEYRDLGLKNVEIVEQWVEPIYKVRPVFEEPGEERMHS